MSKTQHVEIKSLPYGKDNYIYFLIDRARGQTLCVDPGDADLVLDQLICSGLELAGVLCTHHHPDHIGGVDQLVKHFPKLKVFGHHREERIPWTTDPVSPGQSISTPLGNAFILDVSCHTRTHIAYHFESLGSVFSGDSLFSMGCGRMFEGTVDQLAKALKVLMDLPSQTKIYFSHEYTKSNLEFRKSIGHLIPFDHLPLPILRSSIDERGLCTTPTTVEFERHYNPFVWAGVVKQDIALLQTMRQLRDRWIYSE